jgi:hypothetical protein
MTMESMKSLRPDPVESENIFVSVFNPLMS